MKSIQPNGSKKDNRPRARVFAPALCSLIFAVCLLALPGCQNPVRSSGPAESALPETGTLLLAIGRQAAARTILPGTGIDDFVAFNLAFEAGTAGNTDFNLDWTDSYGAIQLDAGTWDLHVTAFLDNAAWDDGPRKAATGSLMGIVVQPGSIIDGDVLLRPIDGPGPGIFIWDIDFPGIVISSARVDITRIQGNGDPFPPSSPYEYAWTYTATSGTSFTGSANLPAGRYRVVFTLINNLGEEAAPSRILHVYPNMVSSFSLSLTALHFITPLLDYILSSWDSVLETWNLAGFTAAHFGLIGVLMGVPSDVPSGVPEAIDFADIIRWFNELSPPPSPAAVPANVMELRALTDAALLGIASETAAFLDADAYASRTEAETAIVARALNNSGVTFQWIDNNRVTARINAPLYEVDFTFALTGTVTIDGTAQVGQTLTANTDALGVSVGRPVAFQWYRLTDPMIPIAGATGNTYTVQAADMGHAIAVRVSRVGDFGGSVLSDPVNVPPQPSLGTHTIATPHFINTEDHFTAIPPGETTTISIPLDTQGHTVTLSVDNAATASVTAAASLSANGDTAYITIADPERGDSFELTLNVLAGSETLASYTALPRLEARYLDARLQSLRVTLGTTTSGTLLFEISYPGIASHTIIPLNDSSVTVGSTIIVPAPNLHLAHRINTTGVWNYTASIVNQTWITTSILRVYVRADSGRINLYTFERGEPGAGTYDNPYRIRNMNDLQNMGSGANGSLGLYYRLENDITLTAPWVPIGSALNPFRGTFDGGGNTVDGLAFEAGINAPDQGMFSVIGDDGVVRNLRLETTISGSGVQVGGIAGTNYGIVENSSVSGNVGGNIQVGGITGINHGTVRNSFFSGNSNITATGQAGGIAGQNFGTVQNSFTTGSVTITSNMVGGLVGLNQPEGIVEFSYSTAVVSGEAQVGGLVGQNSAGGTGAIVRNSVALNEDIILVGTVVNRGRIAGMVGGDVPGLLPNNRALNNLPPAESGFDGIDVTLAETQTQAFWETPAPDGPGFRFGTTDTDPWLWDTNLGRPRLHWE